MLCGCEVPKTVEQKKEMLLRNGINKSENFCKILLRVEKGEKMSLLFLTDIIKRAGIDPSEVKLIRHALSDKTFKKYYEKNMVKEYTQHQRKEFSKGYNFWMVFISDGGSLARFEGLYKVLEEKPDTKKICLREFRILKNLKGKPVSLI